MWNQCPQEITQYKLIVLLCFPRNMLLKIYMKYHWFEISVHFFIVIVFFYCYLNIIITITSTAKNVNRNYTNYIFYLQQNNVNNYNTEAIPLLPTLRRPTMTLTQWPEEKATNIIGLHIITRNSQRQRYQYHMGKKKVTARKQQWNYESRKTCQSATGATAKVDYTWLFNSIKQHTDCSYQVNQKYTMMWTL